MEGVPFVRKGIQQSVFSVKNGIYKIVRGWTWDEALPYKVLLSNLPPLPLRYVKYHIIRRITAPKG